MSKISIRTIEADDPLQKSGGVFVNAHLCSFHRMYKKQQQSQLSCQADRPDNDQELTIGKRTCGRVAGRPHACRTGGMAAGAAAGMAAGAAAATAAAAA